jgi:hypothetical protein
MQSIYSPPPGSEEEIARFNAMQSRLGDQLRRFRSDPTQPYTAVVVPSTTVDPVELAKIEGVAHYEERSLFNLMLLRHPRLRLIYVTSKPINPLVVDYYLNQIRGVPSEHARRRLILLDCDDASARPLVFKILERPRVVKRIADNIDNREMAHLVLFNSTAMERTLAVQLGVPVNACDPELVDLGSKTGSRRVFKEAELPVSPGREGLRDVTDLVEGVAEVWEEVPTARRMVVKLNDSFSGEGNAVLDLTPLADRGPGQSNGRELRKAVRDHLPTLRFEARGLTWEGFSSQFENMGGICELWIDGPEKTSPSVQMRITPLREVQVVSTHDQVLGGPNGCVFLGASFPADARVRLTLQELGRRVGEVLVQKGAIGRFGIDFVTLPGETVEDHMTLYALEINLRQGGTTHPFNTLKFITDGQYDEETGLFRTVQGQARCYFATDALCASEYRGIMPCDLIDLMVVNGIHFKSDDTGVVFHLLGCLSEFGKLGCTAVAHTIPDAKALYGEVVRLLDKVSGRRAAPPPFTSPIALDPPREDS